MPEERYNMTYEKYRLVFLISASLSGLLFLWSIVLFVRLNIPKVWGDVTGRNVKKALQYIRKQNVKQKVTQSKNQNETQSKNQKGTQSKNQNENSNQGSIQKIYNSILSNRYHRKVTDNMSVSEDLSSYAFKNSTHTKVTKTPMTGDKASNARVVDPKGVEINEIEDLREVAEIAGITEITETAERIEIGKERVEVAGAAETTVLESMAMTMLLLPLQSNGQPACYVEQEIIFLHTEEVIN